MISFLHKANLSKSILIALSENDFRQFLYALNYHHSLKMMEKDYGNGRQFSPILFIVLPLFLEL